MACIYDENIFQKYRALAITDASQLEVGKTYYTNHYPAEFTIVAFITERDFFDDETRDGERPFGMRIIKNTSWRDIMSFSDNNIGQSYNPWLGFADSKTAGACKSDLHVQIEWDTEFEPDWDYCYD